MLEIATQTGCSSMRRGRETSFFLASFLALAVGSGCSSTRLETGYQPRVLGAGEAQRKAFYSAKYTRAAAMAEQERGADFRARRPDYRPGF